MSKGEGQKPVLAAVGMFDGVHRGHAFLLRELAAKARETGMRPLALTFARHPIDILRPDSAPKLLGSPRQRCNYIKDTFAIDTAVLDLDAAGLSMTAEEFLRLIHERFGAEALLMGYDNHIGSDRRTGPELADGAAPIPVITAPAYPDVAVCSSDIRHALRNGDIARANELLGHRFTIAGKVVSGRHIGTGIGFPTANIRPEEAAQLLPADGVYAVDMHIGGRTLRGMANIGKRPTVGGEERTFEVNIFDFNEDIYGCEVEAEFLARLRDERRFDSLEALGAQLAADRTAALKI